MTSLILHAGFPKCGSTSVFNAAKANLTDLIDQGIYVFNRNLELPENPSKLQPPLWQIEKAKMDPQAAKNFTNEIRKRVKAAKPEDTLLLSSENLANIDVPKRLFSGLDNECDITLVFYVRPQVDWIPSSWKQWDLKEGITLDASLDRHLERNEPSYLNVISEWQESISNAKIIVRPFIHPLMEGGQPSSDFFSIFGWKVANTESFSAISNPSLDYSILHFLMKHHDLFFENRHDSSITNILTKMLPKKYLRTNIRMLSNESSNKIFEHFYAENIKVFENFTDTDNPKSLLRRYFLKCSDEENYMHAPEDVMEKRVRNILGETFKIAGGNREMALSLKRQLLGHVDK